MNSCIYFILWVTHAVHFIAQIVPVLATVFLWHVVILFYLNTYFLELEGVPDTSCIFPALDLQ